MFTDYILFNRVMLILNGLIMHHITVERSFRPLVALVSAGLMLVLFSTITLAESTPNTCDVTPKYYCAHIDYSTDGVTVSNITRWYEGALDGAAHGYQRWWAADYSYSSGSWQQVAFWANEQGGWATNANLGNWRSIIGGSITQAGATMIRMIYWEVQTASPGYYYWCSQNLEHHEWDNTSIQWGISQC